MIATLFDFNGVLVDDEKVHLAAFRRVLLPRGITISDADYEEKYFGFDDAGVMRAALADAGIAASEDEVKALVEAKKPVYMRLIADELRIFPGAAELVARRAALGPVGIVSGALRDEIEHILGVMGARAHVQFIVAAEDCKECKPHPEGYLAGAAKIAAMKSGTRIVVVEDSVQGVRAGKAAGLRVAAVTHSYPREKLAEADVVVDSLLELTDAVLDGEA